MKSKNYSKKLHQKGFIYAFLVVLMSIPAINHAQNANFLIDDFRHVLKAGAALCTAPLDFDRHTWGQVGLTAVGTAALFAIDKDIKAFALHNQSAVGNAIFRIDSFYGNEYSLVLCGGIYGLGVVSGQTGLRRTGLKTAEAFFFSGAVTGLFKGLFGRRRPYGGESQLVFRPFHISGNTYHSLPSGHATVSFAIATVMAHSYDNPIWRWGWYSSAGLVAGARIYHNKHWLSDIALAGIIGYSVGKFVADYDENKPAKTSPLIFHMTPTGAGVTIRID